MVLLERARAVSPLVERSAEIVERDATVTQEVFAAFKQAELFWMCVPKEVGGLGADFVTVIEVLEEIARADGSTGWSLMANSLATAIPAAFISDEGAKELFGGPERAIIAGLFAPMGKAVEVEGGFKGGGRYQFGSGSAHATHLAGGFLLLGKNGAPQMLGEGIPDARVYFIPRAKVNFLGNWNVMGLVGTGSYDYEVPEQFVPTRLTMEVMDTKHKRGRPFFAIGTFHLAILGHVGVVFGLMKRALEEVVRVTTAMKRTGYTCPTGEYPVFQYQFSLKEGAYQSARAYFLQVLGDAEATAEAGETVSAEQIARLHQASTMAHNIASDVIHFCHLWGGTAAFRNPSALGRCTRDISVATQHLLLDQKTLVDAAPAIIDSYKR